MEEPSPPSHIRVRLMDLLVIRGGGRLVLNTSVLMALCERYGLDYDLVMQKLQKGIPGIDYRFVSH